MRRPTFLALVLVSAVACDRPAQSQADRDAKLAPKAIDDLTEATNVLDAMAKRIPPTERRKAKCVVVVPGMVSGAFLIGVEHGDGVVACRTLTGWSGPTFIKMTGGGAGIQAGIQSADLLMLVKKEGAVATLFRKDFRLGADATVAAGPVGEGKGASTDIQMKADIVTYQQAKGVFAGADVSGVGVKQNLPFARSLYGPIADAGPILNGEVSPPKEASAFLEKLRLHFPND